MGSVGVDGDLRREKEGDYGGGIGLAAGTLMMVVVFVELLNQDLLFQ